MLLRPEEEFVDWIQEHARWRLGEKNKSDIMMPDRNFDKAHFAASAHRLIYPLVFCNSNEKENQS